jgi:hypothetical protein
MKEKMKVNEGSILLNIDYGSNKSAFTDFLICQKEFFIGIEVSGNQYRYSLGIFNDNNNDVEKIAAQMDEESNFFKNADYPKSEKKKFNGFKKDTYTVHWQYRYKEIEANVSVENLVSEVVKDINKLYSEMPKLFLF